MASTEPGRAASSSVVATSDRADAHVDGDDTTAFADPAGDDTTSTSRPVDRDATSILADGDASTVSDAPATVPDRARPLRHGDPGYRPGRRVVRIVRRVQLWSVFKVAVLTSVVLYAIGLLAVAALWSLATSTGQVHHIEKFMRDIGFNDWTFDGGVLFQGALLVGAVGLVVCSVMATVTAAIVNIVSELTGGIRFTVIEEHTYDE